MKRPQVSELSLREKVAQILMIKQGSLLERIEGEEARSNEEIAELMEKYQFGSLYSYGNISMKDFNMASFTFGVKQSAEENLEFIEVFKKHVRIPVLIARDCETGCGSSFAGGTIIPSAMCIGAANDDKLTYELGANLGAEMKSTGVNWSWTPVVDVFNRFGWCNGTRSYGDNVEKVSRHGVALIKGFQSVGMAAGAKHFPGCFGYDPRDSHVAPTVIDLTLEEWWEQQAPTFQAAIDAGVLGIMGTHRAFPAADDEMVNGRYIPCTCSKKVLTDILRNQMGFKGVMITDGINMTALAAQFPREEMLIRAIEAGNDMVCGAILEDFDTLYNAIEAGKLSMERVDEACERVLTLKEQVGLFDENRELPKLEDITPKTRETCKKIVEKSVTLVRDHNHIIPLNKEKIKKVLLIISTHAPQPEKLIEPMVRALEAQGMDVEVSVDLDSADRLKIYADQKDLILYVGYVTVHIPKGMPSLYGEKMATYHSAFSFGAEKSVCVSMGDPLMGNNAMAGGNTYFNIYSPTEASQEAFVKVLFGETPYSTECPVDVTMKRRVIFG